MVAKHEKREMNKAIFLDRDGTIIKENGYISRIKDVVFYHFTFDCLRKLQKDFLLFIITNQPGISKGILNHRAVENVHSYILKKMVENNIKIQEIYYCPHTKEEECVCRKPNPYYVLEASRKYMIDLNKSFVIGDHPSDMRLALNCDANGIYLLTGHGRKHYRELNENIKDKIRACLNLASATRLILKGIQDT